MNQIDRLLNEVALKTGMWTLGTHAIVLFRDGTVISTWALGMLRDTGGVSR